MPAPTWCGLSFAWTVVGVASRMVRLRQVDLRIPPGWYGDFGHLFDLVAINQEVRAQVEAMAREVAPSLRISSDGYVRVAPGDLEVAEHIHWVDLLDAVDIAPIMERHRR